MFHYLLSTIVLDLMEFPLAVQDWGETADGVDGVADGVDVFS